MQLLLRGDRGLQQVRFLSTSWVSSLVAKQTKLQTQTHFSYGGKKQEALSDCCLAAGDLCCFNVSIILFLCPFVSLMAKIVVAIVHPPATISVAGG